MSALYDEATVDAVHAFAWRAIDGHSGAGSARAAAELLDSIAPLIAAKTLREFATNRVVHQTPARLIEDMFERADEIERGE